MTIIPVLIWRNTVRRRSLILLRALLRLNTN